MKIYITGVAGFIGFHLAKKLCAEGHTVYGIDNLNTYYDIELKKGRLAILKKEKNFLFKKIDLLEFKKLFNNISSANPTTIYHLAAQAGVRYSLEQPNEYISSNIQGFLNILEICKSKKIKHLIYASSSSVYGLNSNFPSLTSDKTDNPVSLYAATKKSNEVMAAVYSNLYGINATGLRFFTVYGPWGRPDMALFKFTKSMIEGKKIEVYNHGDMIRDFTYIDDVVSSISLLKDKFSQEKHKVFNLGCGKPIKLSVFIEMIENCLEIKSKKRMLKMQPGDVKQTYSNSEDLFRFIKRRPKTTAKEGISKFVEWYKYFYKI